MLFVVASPESNRTMDIVTDRYERAIMRYVHAVWGEDGKRHTVKWQDGECHQGELWQTVDVVVEPAPPGAQAQ